MDGDSVTRVTRLLLCLGLALVAGRVDAATCFWVGGTGNFSDPTHWASGTGGTASTCAGAGGVPYTGSDSATLDGLSGGGTVTMNVSANTTGTLTTGAFTGTLTDSGNAQSWGTVSHTGSGARTYNLTGAWTITGSGANAWNLATTTNATLTALPTTLTFTNTGTFTFAPGQATYGSVSFTGTNATATLTASASGTVFQDVTVSNATSLTASGAALITCRDLNITAGTWSGNAAFSISRNLTLVVPTSSTSAIMTLNGSSGTQVVSITSPFVSPLTINNSGATTTITSSGTWTPGAIILTAGTVTINGGVVVGTSTFTHTAGSLTVNVPLTTTTYSSSNSNVRSLTLGRPWTLSGTGTILTVATSTNFTASCTGTGGFVIGDATSSAKTYTYSGSEILKCIKYLTPTASNGWTATP